MAWIIGWLTLSFLAGWIAEQKGRSGPGFFLLALVFSPLIGLIAASAARRIDPGAPKPETHIRCPDCREFILKEARACKHCGCKLIPWSERPLECPSCGKTGTRNDKNCAHCGHKMY